MKIIIRLFSFLLVLVFLFSSFGCGVIKKKNGTDIGNEASEYGDPSNSFTLKEKYNIVTHSMYKRTTEISDSIVLVKSALAACGIESFITTDTNAKDDTVTTAKYEILIGYTSRSESQSALEDLGINDYTYDIVSENVIVICGGSSEATYEATKKFCTDILGYNEETNKASLDNAALTVNAGKQYTYNANYDYDSLSVNGVDIKDFSIAIKDSQGMLWAQKILKTFGSYSGFSIPIVEYDELDGSEKGVICVDSFSRDQSIFYDSLVLGGAIMLDIESSKITIGIDAYSNDFYASLLEEFFKKVTITDNNTSLTLTLPENNIELYDLDATYGDMPIWTLKKETKEIIRDGVTYIEQSYTDENSLPYKAYILLIDPNKASLYMGTTNDEYTPTPEDRQSVIGHMQSAVANGVDVIAGTNGGFFYISSDYSPIGLTIKEGNIISWSNSDRAYCGFTKDGKMIIGKNSQGLDTSNLQTAIGGRNMIVHNALPYELEKTGDFGTTSHPRTLAGVMEDGTMILAVIDGRQRRHSNGAPLSVCARFMISLGAVDAVNLDGGGSSTMVIRNGNNYDVKNSPSDGSPRKIFNSVLVVAKNN